VWRISTAKGKIQEAPLLRKAFKASAIDKHQAGVTLGVAREEGRREVGRGRKKTISWRKRML